MRVTVNGLVLRNGIYYFRRAVPPELRESAGKSEWKQSLKLRQGEDAQARLAADKLWRRTDLEIRRLRSEQALKANPAQIAADAADWAAQNDLLEGGAGRRDRVERLDHSEYYFESQADLEMSAIIEEAERQFGRDHKGRPKGLTPEQEARLDTLSTGKPIAPKLTVTSAHELYVKQRFEGGDKATDAAVDQFIALMGDVELSTITRPRVGEWMRRLQSERGQSAATVKRRIGVMKAIFNFAIDNYQLNAPNPFTRQKPPKTAKAADDRLPFHRSHYEKLDAYLASNAIDADVHDILQLLRYTGCRPMEVGGLSVRELNLTAETPLIRLKPTSARTLKTSQSARPIPLIGPGLEAAQRALRRASGPYLFPESFHRTDRLSQRLNKALRASGIPKSRRLVAYSFRHSMAEALRVAGVSQDVRQSLLGHAEGGAAGGYGASFRPLDQLREGLQEALPRLGEVDTAHYGPDELPYD